MKTPLDVFLEHISWTGFAKVSSAALSLAQIFLATRLLSQIEFGMYLLTLSLVLAVSTVAQWGWSAALVARLAPLNSYKDSGAISEVLSKMLLQFFLGALAFAPLVLLTPIDWILPNTSVSIQFLERLLIWFYILGHGLIFLLPEAFRGLGQIRMASLYTGPLPHLITVAILIFFFLRRQELELKHMLQILCFSWWICNTHMLFALKKYFVLHKDLISQSLRNYSRQFAMAGFQIVLFLSTQADLWLVNYLADPESVGIYGVAQKLMVFMTFTPLVLGVAASPQMSSLYHSGKALELSTIMRRSAKLSSAIAFGILVIFWFWGPQIISKLFGPSYITANKAFLTLGIAQALSLSCGPLGYFFLMTGQQNFLLKASCFSILVSLTIALFFRHSPQSIPTVVAFASGVGLLVQSALFFIKARTQLKRFTLWSWTHG